MNKRIIEQFTELINLHKMLGFYSPGKSRKLASAIFTKEYNYLINIIKSLKEPLKSVYELKDYKLQLETINKLEFILDNPKTELPTITRYKFRIKAFIKNNTLLGKLSRLLGNNDKIALDLTNYNTSKNLNKISSIKKLVEYIEKNKIYATADTYFSLKNFYKFKINIPYDEITRYNELLIKLFNKYDKNIKFTICGSYRREFESSNDINIVLSHKKYSTYNSIMKAKILGKIIKLLEINKILIPHNNYIDNNNYYGLCKLDKRLTRRINITIVGFKNYIFAIMRHTGNYTFNRYYNFLAKKYNIKIDNKKYVLYDNNDNEINIKSEFDLFKIVNHPYIEPKKRIDSLILKGNVLKENDCINEDLISYIKLGLNL